MQSLITLRRAGKFEKSSFWKIMKEKFLKIYLKKNRIF
jgi:hypothetical protein